MFQMARPHHLSHLLYSTWYYPHHRFRLQIKTPCPGAHGWIGRNELTEHESGSLPPDRFSNAWMPSSRVRIWFPDGYDNVCLTAQTIMGMGLWLWVVEWRTMMMALLDQPCGESPPGILLDAGGSCRGASAAAAAAAAMRAVSVCVVRRRLFPSMGALSPSLPKATSAKSERQGQEKEKNMENDIGLGGKGEGKSKTFRADPSPPKRRCCLSTRDDIPRFAQSVA
jgi:hypothetical protein